MALALDPFILADCQAIGRRMSFEGFAGRRVLITGANGFLGSYICSALHYANQIQSLGCRVDCVSLGEPRGVVREICKNDSMFSAVAHDMRLPLQYGHRPDFIFHAATYGQPARWMANQLTTIELNSSSLKHLLDLAVESEARLMFFSSVDIYGDMSEVKGAVDETFAGNLSTEAPRAAYGEAKRLGEAMCALYRREHQLPAYAVRPAHTYGPGIYPGDRRVIAEFLSKGLNFGKISLLDDGMATKTYGYISDVTEMFLNIIQSGKFMSYNTVGKDIITIRGLADTISSVLGGIPVQVPDCSGGGGHIGTDQKWLHFSCRRYEEEFGVMEMTPLEEGVARFVDWYRDALTRGNANGV